MHIQMTKPKGDLQNGCQKITLDLQFGFSGVKSRYGSGTFSSRTVGFKTPTIWDLGQALPGI